MKILVVHQYYLLAGWPGGSRFNEMTRAWAEQGHEITVVAGTVDYSTGVVPERYRWRWIVREQDGPVSVWRCYVPGSYNRGYVGRALALLAFMLSACSAVFLAGRHDVVIATSPPLLAVVPGWIAARLRWRPAPWIFEVRDLWPESAITTGVLSARSFLARLLYRVERWAYASATRINVLTPAFADNIVRRGLAAREKILFVPNGADTESFTPSDHSELRRELERSFRGPLRWSTWQSQCNRAARRGGGRAPSAVRHSVGHRGRRSGTPPVAADGRGQRVDEHRVPRGPRQE